MFKALSNLLDGLVNKAHEKAKRVRDALLGFPEIANVSGRVGRLEDGTDPTGPFNSEYFVDLKPYSQRKRNITKEQLEGEIREKVSKFCPNADISVTQYIEDNLEEKALREDFLSNDSVL